MEYTHAKDFLIELANNPQTHGWLKDLIIKIVNSNETIQDTELKGSVDQLKTNASSVLALPSTNKLNQHTDIRLVSLTHYSGVCALKNKQTIVFSNDITLLYGKNGSGKSSYFKILNEIIGGNHQAEVRSNIYSGKREPINVELVYTVGTDTKKLSWNGTARAINPLARSSVFDSNYTKTFLQKRSADSSIVLPYGLHLFSALTTAMDNMKKILQTEIDTIMNNIPKINIDGLSDDVCAILERPTDCTKQKEYIQDRYDISDDQLSKLEHLENQLKALKETNFEDKIKLAISENSEFLSLYNHLTSIQDRIKTYTSKTKDIIEKITATRKMCEEVKSKIEILSENR